MKKIRIMLAAIVVLASVGGVLAFKAKTFNGLYCVRGANSPANTCTFGLIARSSTNGTTYYYTTTNNLDPALCTTLKCTRSTKFTAE